MYSVVHDPYPLVKRHTSVATGYFLVIRALQRATRNPDRATIHDWLIGSNLPTPASEHEVQICDKFYTPFPTDLSPINNTVIDRLPATFYCLIKDTFGMNISTDWYINGLSTERTLLLMEYTRIEPEGANTNLTIFSLRFIDTLMPSVNVSCRTSIFPNVTYGFYQVGKP